MSGLNNQTVTAQRCEMDWSGQGATAASSGGEPEQVGGCPRPQDWCPESPHKRVLDRVTPILFGIPDLRCDGDTVVDRAPDSLEWLGGGSGRHGFDGRTLI